MIWPFSPTRMAPWRRSTRFDSMPRGTFLSREALVLTTTLLGASTGGAYMQTPLIYGEYLYNLWA